MRFVHPLPSFSYWFEPFRTIWNLFGLRLFGVLLKTVLDSFGPFEKICESTKALRAYPQNFVTEPHTYNTLSIIYRYGQELRGRVFPCITKLFTLKGT